MKNQFRHVMLSPKYRWPFCIILSLAGIFFYLAPIYDDGTITTPLAMLVKVLLTLFGPQLPALIAIIMVTAAILPLLAWVCKPMRSVRNRMLHFILHPSCADLLIRLTGAVLVLIIFFDAGPRILRGHATGSMVVNHILPAVFLSLLLGGLLLPLLLNFGLPEFCGVLMHSIMRPLFGLPGKSAVTCMASWIGDNCVGILLANQQYEQGQYTLRETVVICTTFSPVSIAFSLVIITQVNLVHMFIPFYLTVCLAGFVAAAVVPRLPPLACKPDVYVSGAAAADRKAGKMQKDLLPHAIEQANQKAEALKGLDTIAAGILSGVLIMIVTVLPITAAVATAALVLAEHSTLFQCLGKPFVPLLAGLNIPEASATAECLVVGFTDMILPSVLAGKIESDLSRFFVAAMSVVQLVYLSEPGALLLASNIRISIIELFLVFMLRTLVSMPVVALMAHLFF